MIRVLKSYLSHYEHFRIHLLYREQALQDQLRQAKDSVSTMQKLHELAQSQLFELRAQSGVLS